MLKRTKTEIPVGVESAAHRFASACKRDGWSGCVVLTASNGSVNYISNVGDLYELVEGEWFKGEKVD